MVPSWGGGPLCINPAPIGLSNGEGARSELQLPVNPHNILLPLLFSKFFGNSEAENKM